MGRVRLIDEVVLLVIRDSSRNVEKIGKGIIHDKCLYHSPELGLPGIGRDNSINK